MSASRRPRADLHPEAVSNLEVGYLYEELIRRFSDLSNDFDTYGHLMPDSLDGLAKALDAIDPEPDQNSGRQ